VQVDDLNVDELKDAVEAASPLATVTVTQEPTAVEEASSSEASEEASPSEDVDECACKDNFMWGNDTYSDCVVTEEDGKPWCYVIGDADCTGAVESTTNAGEYYKECEEEMEVITEVTVVFELSYDNPLSEDDKTTEEQNIQSGIVNSTGLASDQVDVDMQLKETGRRLLASVYETKVTFKSSADGVPVQVDDLNVDELEAAVAAASPLATVTVTQGPQAETSTVSPSGTGESPSTGCIDDGGDCEEYYYEAEGVCKSEPTIDDVSGTNCRVESPTEAIEGSAALLIPNMIAIISVISCAVVAY
jgi:hypothetical protein